MKKNNLDVVKKLIDLQADPSVVNENQRNLIESAKDFQNQHNETSRYLKSMIGFKKSDLENFQKDCQSFFKNQLAVAELKGKKLLILIGESHGNYKIYQIEKQMLKAAQAVGITTNYQESPYDTPVDALAKFSKKTLKMDLHGVDKHFLRKKPKDVANDILLQEQFILERDEIIRKKIEKHNKHGISMLGVAHLQGMLSSNTRLDPNKFHVVPFNLWPLTKQSPGMFPPQLTRIQFAHSDPSIIQIKEAKLPSKANMLYPSGRPLPAPPQKVTTAQRPLPVIPQKDVSLRPLPKTPQRGTQSTPSPLKPTQKKT